MARHLLLGGLALAAGLMAVVVGMDLASHPRDLWAAGLFVLGSLCGAAWERHRDGPP